MGDSAAGLLVVGLGNPGAEYDDTRHNAGFWVVDRLLADWRFSPADKFHGRFASGDVGTSRVYCLKPQTYMNRSGLAVGEAVRFYKLDPAKQLLVLADDIDLVPGALRLRTTGGNGGHNGLRSIIESLGTEDFLRVRIGVGRPPAPHRGVENWVLGRPGAEERAIYQETIQTAAEAVRCILADGFPTAMNRFNRRGPPAAEAKEKP